MSPITTSTKADLALMMRTYKAAVEEWIKAIRTEEDLVSADPTLAEIDHWEHAHYAEEEARDKAKLTKKQYEDALRRKLFNF